VKNQRKWFYEADQELHHFLTKAATFQVQRPDLDVIPIFACSWRQDTAYRLGRLLGFYAVGYKLQYVLDRSEISPPHFSEVVNELGYEDLRLGTEPNTSMRLAIGPSLAKNALDVAARWKAVAPVVHPFVRDIRDAPDHQTRQTLVETMKSEVENQFGEPSEYEPLPDGRG
jgi:hypothetical protein